MGGGGGGVPPWLATTQCSPPPSADALAFIFLSPCPQRALLGAIDLLFLIASLVLALVPRRGANGTSAEHEPLLSSTTPTIRCTGRYAVALGASAVTAALSAVLLALAVFLLPATAAAPWRAVEAAFLAAHSAAHAVAAWTVVASGKRAADARPHHLRILWIATALGAALLSASAAIRWAEGSLLFPDDILTFAGLLLSLPLAHLDIATAPITSTWMARDGEEEQDQRPSTATPYATASFLSRATFSWINPLVSKAHASGSLAADDVPPVSPAHLAEAAHALLATNWPQAASASRSPVGVAVWLSFWPQLLLTAALGLAQLAAMYVGPCLIDRFVALIRRGATPWEGLQLVLTLLVGKAVETLASHHYNFQGQLLCMRIRGALLTALYGKSLRLSAGARRAHGAGAIVNYMQVDAWIVSGAMHRLHDLWLMPLQIVVALLLLYSYLGPAVLMTLAVIAAVTVVTAFANKLNMTYQLGFVGVRDSRVKALAEMLSHMRVIKMQAWEETFGGRVRELRREEVGWLKKMILFECASTVVFSSGPVAMTVLVFGTYLAAGGELDAGKVFTAAAFFRMLEGPMSSFPQTIAMSVQAFVSLGRLDKFLSDAEIDSMAVDRLGSGGAGDVAVKVQGGVFAWDDVQGGGEEKDGGGEEPVLKGIEMEVRKGELAAVVGTVGSGKSSLLSCIMGDMHKVSGKIAAA